MTHSWQLKSKFLQRFLWNMDSCHCNVFRTNTTPRQAGKSNFHLFTCTVERFPHSQFFVFFSLFWWSPLEEFYSLLVLVVRERASLSRPHPPQLQLPTASARGCNWGLVRCCLDVSCHQLGLQRGFGGRGATGNGGPFHALPSHTHKKNTIQIRE